MKSHNASSPELSLIVPTYNESENIKTLVERVHKSLSDYNYELIVVDDNSPDGTAELAKSLSSKYPVRVIVRTNERGLASAVVAGFKQAKGDILGVIDADLQHPPEFVPNLIKGVKEGADVAIASRYIKGGAIEGWTLKRKIISLGAKLPANVLLTAARKIKDPLSGFFLFRKQVIEGTELSPTGYKILLEVLV
ncbi:MAG TPA: polyprenol monophosphomannose synthase, partial [Dehalococcoidia bacterium]|nr:polyprenol monophosphomannose synthase [Dehalococcoidia bacterium]